MRTVRGTMNYKPKKDDDPLNRKLMMTNATLTEAVYEAARREPTNPHVVATIQAGIDDCTEYHEDIPTDVELWIIDKHNMFHHGSGVSLLQLCEKVLAGEKMFIVYRESKGISSSAPGYEKLYWQYTHREHCCYFPL